MTFILIYLLLLLTSSLYCFDPDIDICENPVIDSAVNADDGQTYIFKGNYFWQTQPLNTMFGIIGYANTINHNWHNLPHPIRAAFAIPDQFGQLMTVFIHENNWYLYAKHRLIKSGSTMEWSKAAKNISTAFAENYNSSLVYLLNDDRTQYTLIDFKNTSKPILVKSGKTTVNYNFIWFIENSELGSDKVLADLIDVKAIVNYQNLLLIISDTSYCKVDLSRKKFEKECAPKSYQKTLTLLGCPFDVSKRPITAFTISSLTHSSTTTTTTIYSDENISTNKLKPTINTTDNPNNGSEIQEYKKKSSSSSSSVFLIFVGIIAILLVITIISVVIFVILRRKKPSANTYYVK